MQILITDKTHRLRLTKTELACLRKADGLIDSIKLFDAGAGESIKPLVERITDDGEYQRAGE